MQLGSAPAHEPVVRQAPSDSAGPGGVFDADLPGRLGKRDPRADL